MTVPQAALVFAAVAPGCVFTCFALLWLAGWVPGERTISRVTGITFSACALALLAPLSS